MDKTILEKPIIVIGDVIQDIYTYGTVIGVANEDPVLKFRPNKRYDTISGGAAFVADAMKSFLNKDITLIPTTTSSIVRHIDSKYNRNVFTLDSPSQISHLSLEDIESMLDINPAVIIVWDDQRSSAMMDLVRTAIRRLIFRGRISHTKIIVDSPSKKWNTSFISYWKMSSDEYDVIGPIKDPILATNMIITSSTGVSLYHRGGGSHKFPVKTVDKPVDTCGAGDVFLSVFSSLLYEDDINLHECIAQGITYSSESVMHMGCYMPPRQKENNGSQINNKI